MWSLFKVSSFLRHLCCLGQLGHLRLTTFLTVYCGQSIGISGSEANFRKQKLQICAISDDQWAEEGCVFSGNPYMTVASSRQHPRTRHLALSASRPFPLVKSPAKAAPHWSTPFSLRPCESWRDFAVLVGGFKQFQKKGSLSKFWGIRPANLDKAIGLKRRQSRWGWARRRSQRPCSPAASASPGTHSRSWARASSCARWALE